MSPVYTYKQCTLVTHYDFKPYTLGSGTIIRIMDYLLKNWVWGRDVGDHQVSQITRV